MTKPSQFCWYELMADDPDAAEAFYRAVVGWGAQDSGQTAMRYTLLTAGEQPVAGLMGLSSEACAAGARPGWGGYIAVENVDTGAARLAEAGGAVHYPPADIPGVGRFAIVADPQGSGFTLFQPAPGTERPSAAMGTPGHVGWHELHAADGESAFAFYAGQFGWTKGDALDMGPMGVYQLFAAGGADVGGMMTKMDGTPAPGWLFYFNVDGIDAAIARITLNGGRVLMGPHEVPGGSWIVQGMDPEDAMFALVAPRR